MISRLSRHLKSHQFSTVARDVKRTALVLIEYQNEFATEGGKLHGAVKAVMDASNMLANSVKLVATARSKGVKIVHAPITFSEDYRELRGTSSGFGILANVRNGNCFQAKEWGGAFCENMVPSPEDIVIQGKRGLCAFASTNLEFILRQNDIDTIALAGFLTNCCVESTMRTAYEKGFKVITLTDCTAATSLEEQEAAVKYTYPMFSNPTTSNEFLKTLQ
jgi:ureidoacrylate peracid hydrolase